MICELQLAHDQAPALLAAARQTPGLAVIAIGGGGLAGAQDQIRRATAQGARGVLHKPFETDTLLAVVERVLDGIPTGVAPWRGTVERAPTPSA
jgi:DNA-binding NtrC family response regulator